MINVENPKRKNHEEARDTIIRKNYSGSRMCCGDYKC